MFEVGYQDLATLKHLADFKVCYHKNKSKTMIKARTLVQSKH